MRAQSASVFGGLAVVVSWLAFVAGCGGGGGAGSGGNGGRGGSGGAGGSMQHGTFTQTLTPVADTFVNARNPDNNNGGSDSMFTGVDGMGGIMRVLIQFAPPADWQGRTTVTGAVLKVVLRAPGRLNGGAATTESLQAIAEAWAQGTGVGDDMKLYTVGQTCGGSVTGATWNQPACADGTTTTWTTPGGTVVATVSGQADTTGIAFDSPVVWDSAAAGNAGMIGDVQSWIDTPGGNHGWRITSSDESTVSAAQRFYTTEYLTMVPTLTITYTQ